MNDRKEIFKNVFLEHTSLAYLYKVKIFHLEIKNFLHIPVRIKNQALQLLLFTGEFKAHFKTKCDS